MKIGTWNLDARWSPEHEAILIQENCDVWLLTEVPEAAFLSGYCRHLSKERMTRGQYYAAILSRSQQSPLKDPHAASAACVIDGVTYWSSILPWSSCGVDTSSPWHGVKTVAEMIDNTIDQLLKNIPTTSLVWGGDWNQNINGGWQYVGSNGGRSLLNNALARLNLQVPTASLPHRIHGFCTIDQIAVPKQWVCGDAARIKATNLSDHDAYTIEVSSPF